MTSTPDPYLAIRAQWRLDMLRQLDAETPDPQHQQEIEALETLTAWYATAPEHRGNLDPAAAEVRGDLALIESTSLGTPQARALRDTTPPAVVCAVLARVFPHADQ